MNMPPQRIAWIALVAVLLVAGVAWWWRGGSARVAYAFAEVVPHGVTAPASGPGVPIPDARTFSASMGQALATCSREIASAFNARALELREKQDASSQLAYALTMDFSLGLERLSTDERQRVFENRQSEARAGLLRAAALAPDDLDVLWLVASRCGSGSECFAAQRALLAAEPDNVAVWLREMDWARMRGDLAASKAAFELAAAGSGYDTHRSATHAMIRLGYADVPMPAACLHPDVPKAAAHWRSVTGMPAPVGELGVLDHALGLANINMTNPSYIDIRQQCVPTADVPIHDEKRAACQRVMSRLADGETLIEQAVSLDAMVRLTVDEADASHWRERYRQSRWLIQQQANISFHSLLRPEDFADGEVPAIQALLEAAGRWPPPADWLPDDEHSRSLILTGRPPVETKRR